MLVKEATATTPTGAIAVAVLIFYERIGHELLLNSFRELDEALFYRQTKDQTPQAEIYCPSQNATHLCYP